MPTPKVLDLSHYNTVATSLKPAYAAGVRAVVHKATEGMGALDAKCGARYFLAREAGLLWGVYHFMRPGNAKTQAEWFLTTTSRLIDASTLLVLDYEVAAIPLTDVLVFLETIEKATGRWPVLYSGNTLKEAISVAGSLTQSAIGKYRLWLAQYATTYNLPAGFTKPWLWQYTDKGKIDGLDGDTDCSTYLGSDDDLRRDWTTDSVVIVPEPSPLPPPVPSSATFGIAVAAPAGAPVQVFVNGVMVFHGVAASI